jgi:hypothetical protein
LLHAWAPERLSRENDATEDAETTICDARPARASLHPGLKQQTNAGPTNVWSGSKRKKMVPEQERETQIAAGHESPSRKPNEKFMEYAQYVGMFLLLALVLFSNGNDIVRLFTK